LFYIFYSVFRGSGLVDSTTLESPYVSDLTSTKFMAAIARLRYGYSVDSTAPILSTTVLLFHCVVVLSYLLYLLVSGNTNIS
jgi:hypothetical protein